MNPDASSTLSCFKCESPIQPLLFTDRHGKTHDTGNLEYAMPFISHGGYGSVVYDPMTTVKFLRINICDFCVKEAAARGLVLEGIRLPQPDSLAYEPFDPRTED